MNKLSAFALAAVVAALSACGGSKNQAAPIAEKAPEWVNKGSAALKDGGQGVIYGVGIASGIRNRALSVSTADERGRAEITKILNSYVTSLSKDYMASTTGGAMDKSSEEQHVQSTMKNFAKASLHGSTVVDHWKDPSDGTMFSLVKLDMASIQKTIEQSKELDGKVRDFIRANAEKAFDDLAAEEARR